MVNEISLRNLRPIPPELRHKRQKGEISITTELKKQLRERQVIKNPFTGAMERKSNVVIIALTLIQKAVKEKDLGAIKEILDRIEGNLNSSGVNLNNTIINSPINIIFEGNKDA